MRTNDWRNGIEAVQREAGGVLSLAIIRARDMPALLAAAMLGNAEAALLAQCVYSTLRGFRRAPRNRPMLCACCPRPVPTTAFALVVADPGTEGKTLGLTLAICEHCATTDDGIQAKAVAALQTIWPQLRRVTVHTAGHA
jgi:hypothetical protein